MLLEDMKFDKEHLIEIVNLFPFLKEVVIVNPTAKLGIMGHRNFRFDLHDLIDHLNIFSYIKDLRYLQIKNIYSTKTEDAQTIDEQLKYALRLIHAKFSMDLEVKIPIGSFGYTFVEIVKEKCKGPVLKRCNDVHVY